MSLTVQLYKWHKRRNSTKQPGVADPHTDFSCTLKEPTSIHNPVIILATNDCDFTYAHISAWSRYYFVDDVVYVHNGLVEYHLTEDVLASNKTDIGNTVAHIAYASTGYNSFIVDPRIEVSTSKFAERDYTGIGLRYNYYLLTVYNNLNHSSAMGMCDVYILTDSQIGSLKNQMASSTIMDDLADYFHGDSLTGIISCKWIPYKPIDDGIGGITEETNSVTIGDKTFSITGAHRLKRYATMGDIVSFNKSPVYSDFRNSDPYTSCMIYLPGAGLFPLSLNDFASSDKIYLNYSIEIATGNIYYFVYTQTNNVVLSVSADISAEVPIGRIIANNGGAVNSGIATAGGIGAALVGAVSGNMALVAGGAATAIASASNMALSSNQHTASVMGGIGGRGVQRFPLAEVFYYAMDTVDPTSANYIATMGRPCGKTEKINLHSGYVECINAHVSADADAQELSEIESYLNSGIYYE